MKRIYLVLTIVAAVYVFFLVTTYLPEPEPQTSSISTSIEDRCDFVMKKTGSAPFTISEDSAGTYNYELYIATDGSIEIWSCPPNELK